MNRIITACVMAVQTIVTRAVGLYYSFTIHLPRRLPRTHEEYNALKGTLHRYYGLEDDPQIWSIVANQVQSPKATSIRIPYASIVNATKRFYMNAVAQDHKMIAYKEINARLERITKQAAEDFKREEEAKHIEGGDNDIRPQWSDVVPGAAAGTAHHVREGASDLQRNLQSVPVITERMV